MGVNTKQALVSAGSLAAGGLAAAVAWKAIRRTPGHPVFSRCYGVLARLTERGELGRRRSALTAGATGLVLELGAGTGEGFKHYRPSIAAIVAVEPDPTMLRMAARRAHEAPVPIRLVQARGEALPFRDGAFDTAVSTLVLCSVDDPSRTLEELRRLLRPGGRLLFLEHVRAQDNRLARWQDKLERPWGALSGGCHPNRPTLAAIRNAGFETSDVEHFDLKPGIPLVHPHIQGTALRP
jgi:SAM-dependent methyltransferase